MNVNYVEGKSPPKTTNHTCKAHHVITQFGYKIVKSPEYEVVRTVVVLRLQKKINGKTGDGVHLKAGSDKASPT